METKKNVEVDFNFFRTHVQSWVDFEKTMLNHRRNLTVEDLPTLSGRFGDRDEGANLRRLVPILQQAQDKLADDLLDASRAAGKIADALFNTARSYARTESSNEAEAKGMMKKLDRETR